MRLRDVRDSIGKDRQQWHLALEAELQSLRDTGAIETVTRATRQAGFAYESRLDVEAGTWTYEEEEG